jgi:methylthioribose-1-phosphate isomerase
MTPLDHRAVTMPDIHPLRASRAARTVEIVDQTLLPGEWKIVSMTNVSEAAHAIRTMQVRGAPLIGATAAYGLALAMHADPSDIALRRAHSLLFDTRPTAVNLRWALDRVTAVVSPLPASSRAEAAWREADSIAAEDERTNLAIGRHGAALIERLAADGRNPVQILTHCNAGVLATVAWGTATAPIYVAHGSSVAVHVWVSETRPRMQGARLTAWELRESKVPHTLIVDAAGAALMQQGRIDLILVGADRVAANGDVCNKIGTYEKALAAKDNGVPMYAAVPSSTIDWSLAEGSKIPIEERDPGEVLNDGGGRAVAPVGTAVMNPAFDVTPFRLLTGLITERGICRATAEGLAEMFPERRA